MIKSLQIHSKDILMNFPPSKYFILVFVLVNLFSTWVIQACISYTVDKAH